MNHTKRIAVVEHQLAEAKLAVRVSHQTNYMWGVKQHGKEVKRLSRELKALKKAARK
jgi:hypothetical protein